MNLGSSPAHSHTANRILNPVTGHVSPQYHCVYDELFSTVVNAEPGRPLNADPFTSNEWQTLLELGHERLLSNDELEDGVPFSEFFDEFDEQTEPAAGSEGDDDDAGPLVPPSWAPTPPIRIKPGVGPASPKNPRVGPRVDPPVRSGPEFEPTPSVPSSPGSPLPTIPEGAPEPTDASAEDSDEAPEPSPRRTRSGRPIKAPVPFDEKMDDPRYKSNKAHYVATHATDAYYQMDNAHIHGLDWDTPIEDLKSYDLKSMLTRMELDEDPDLGTCEEWDPMLLAAKASSEDVPNWHQAMNGPLREGFESAMATEVDTLQRKDCWEETPQEPWMNVVKSTWAFKVKRYPDSTVKKLKARFCVRGDTQVEGVDFFDTYAPVVQWSTVRLLLILSILLNLQTCQVDYTAAFVHAPIDMEEDVPDSAKSGKDVYVEMPKGFRKPGTVLRLKKSLYGLRQSPRNWFLHLTKNLEKIGFKQMTDIDPCLFISKKVVLVSYVDDCVLAAKNQEDIDEVIEALRNAELELEKESDVAGFLGVDIKHQSDGSIKLSQPGLAMRVVEALNLDGQFPKATPATDVLPLDPDGDPPHGTYGYSSVVGMLMYLMRHTRPELAFAVSQVARFTHNPKRSHELALERIGLYLMNTINEGVIMNPLVEDGNLLLDIDAYVDADFAGLYGKERTEDPSCAKSRTGYVICIAGCPIVWSSKLQPDIALSTMQSEYHALSMCMRDLIPMIELVKCMAEGVGLPQDQVTRIKTTVWEDNIGALTLANLDAGHSTSRSRHYLIRYHWFRSHLKVSGMNKVLIEKIDTKEQLGDLFTKPLTRVTFELLRHKLIGW